MVAVDFEDYLGIVWVLFGDYNKLPSDLPIYIGILVFRHENKDPGMNQSAFHGMS